MSVSRFLAGAAVGAAVALLMAPKKGEDLRDDISDTAHKWKGKLDKMAGKADTRLDDLRSLLSREIGGLKDDVRKRMLTILDEAAEMSYDPKRHMSNGVL